MPNILETGNSVRLDAYKVITMVEIQMKFEVLLALWAEMHFSFEMLASFLMS